MQNILIENLNYILIIVLFGTMIFITYLNSKFFASFKLIFLRRWIRLVFASLLGGEILFYLYPDRPLGTLCLVSLLLYFLGETVLYWFAVSFSDWEGQLSKRFYKSDVSWSSQRRHIKLKNKIESYGFAKTGSFMEVVFDEPVYANTFDSVDKLIRITVCFMVAGKLTYMLSSVESVTRNGKRILTQSRCVPSGVVRSNNCDIRFVALESNPLKLLAIHKKRIEPIKSELVTLPDDPLADLNNSIDSDIAENQKQGRINPVGLWNSEGVFTDEGKYLFWKDLIIVNYLPFIKL